MQAKLYNFSQLSSSVIRHLILPQKYVLKMVQNQE